MDDTNPPLPPGVRIPRLPVRKRERRCACAIEASLSAELADEEMTLLEFVSNAFSASFGSNLNDELKRENARHRRRLE